ncbi:MAG TPA: hypothetical protein VMF50_08600 [Candidatus Binataceae bacterium]|nr:hypothetical protein [Candidatus Binataceae bacterium]
MPFSEITKLDLVPQAILRKPLSYFQRHLHMDIVRGEDDLDAFEGAALSLNGTLPFALKHYAGYPENTTTIYLSGNVTDIDAITSIINTIVRELELNNEAVEWQRSDDPDL